MRTFRIEIISNDEVVIQYPLPTTYKHNGVGGGTETPIPLKSEWADIKKMLKTLTALKLREVEVPKE